MTKGEIETIRNIVARLKEPRCGSGAPWPGETEHQARGYEGVSRVYLDSWIIPALAHLLPEDRDVELAERLSRR
jgi:hypothetical protein